MLKTITVVQYKNDELLVETTVDVETKDSWYTAQNYFNDNLKDDLFSFCDVIKIKWHNNKNYEFRRKTDDDSRHEEKRA